MKNNIFQVFSLLVFINSSHYTFCQDIHMIDDAIILPLSTDVGYQNAGISSFMQDDRLFVYLLYQHNIVRYTLDENGVFIAKRRIPLQREGPNGIGDISLEGLTVVDTGRLVLYSYWTKEIIELDQNGEVMNKYDLTFDDISYPVLRTSSSQPIIVSKKGYYLAGHLYQTMPSDKLVKPICHLDTMSNKAEFVGLYPIKTYEGSWGVSHITYIDAVDQGGLVISFSISDSLQILSNGEVFQYVAKSKYIDEFKPISREYNYNNGANRQELIDHTLDGQYYMVRYDKWKKLTYRFVILDRDAQAYQNMEDPVFSVIILNDKFRVINETILPKGLYPQDAFITHEGLFIFNKQKYSNVSDDYLSFTLIDVCDY